MTIKPIEILSSNLLDLPNIKITRSFDSETRIKTVDIDFSDSLVTDTIIIKNTDALSIKVQTIIDEQPTTLAEVTENTKASLIIRFNEEGNTLQNLRLTFHNPQTDIREGEIILCKSILMLSQALTTLTRNDYNREGYHYTADGTLIKWHEFTKFGCNLKIQNLTKDIRDSILKHNMERAFLTYIFYGEHDGDFCYQLTTKSHPVESFDRRTGLYQLDLQLLER